MPISLKTHGVPRFRLRELQIKKLGHGSRKDYALTAAIIEQHFDIVAVVEVMQKQGGHPGYDQLRMALGTTWTGMVTAVPRPDTTSGSAEFYAVFYRPARVRPCQGWTALVYYRDNDGSTTGTGDDVFSREPAFGCFRALTNTNEVGFDFMLAAYHARWAHGDIDEIQTEVRHLADVFVAMRTARPGEGDLLIVGDFNLVPADLDEAIHSEVPTLGSGSTLNDQGQRTRNLYDHLIVFDPTATTELVGAAEVFDVRGAAVDPRTFFRTVSDHLPLVARFRVSADDD